MNACSSSQNDQILNMTRVRGYVLGESTGDNAYTRPVNLRHRVSQAALVTGCERGVFWLSVNVAVVKSSYVVTDTPHAAWRRSDGNCSLKMNTVRRLRRSLQFD
jgi:hypothetical protein